MRHVAVEFVHPVIVGKRALPAIGLAARRPARRQVELLAEPDDIVIASAATPVAAAALALARGRGCLTIALRGGRRRVGVRAADATTRSSRQELVETLYHVLWELVHVFFEHRGLLEGREARRVHDTGASSFLYPFLAEARAPTSRRWSTTCAARC